MTESCNPPSAHRIQERKLQENERVRSDGEGDVGQICQMTGDLRPDEPGSHRVGFLHISYGASPRYLGGCKTGWNLPRMPASASIQIPSPADASMGSAQALGLPVLSCGAGSFSGPSSLGDVAVGSWNRGGPEVA